MRKTFRDALVWHLDTHKTVIADLVRQSGVSRDVVNKLKGRADSSTEIENAIAIAAYYGKSVEQFIRCEEPSEEGVMSALLALLTVDERKVLLAQVRGMVAHRAAEAG